MQEKILNELLTQGMREDMARMISRLLKNKVHQEMMMEYLISARDKTVTELDVIQLTQKLSKLESLEEDKD